MQTPRGPPGTEQHSGQEGPPIRNSDQRAPGWGPRLEEQDIARWGSLYFWFLSLMASEAAILFQGSPGRKTAGNTHPEGRGSVSRRRAPFLGIPEAECCAVLI